MNFDIINALLSGFFLSFMVGPVFFVLLETSATKGIKKAIIFDLGVIFADIVFIIISYYGSYALLSKIKDDPRLFFAGGLILFSYGLIIFIKEKRKTIILDPSLVVVEKTSNLGMFLKGFLLNFINVGVLGFWLALIIVISSNVGMDGNRVFLYFSTIILAYFITDLGKIFLAKQLKSKLTPRIINKIRKIMGIILMIIGIAIASKAIIPQKTLDNIQQKAEEVIK